MISWRSVRTPYCDITKHNECQARGEMGKVKRGDYVIPLEGSKEGKHVLVTDVFIRDKEKHIKSVDRTDDTDKCVGLLLEDGKWYYPEDVVIPAENEKEPESENNDTVISEIHAVRIGSRGIEMNVIVRVIHKRGIDLLDAMDRCFTDWYKTPEGRSAWDYTCGDLNVGDMLAGEHPTDDFTMQYGFIVLYDDTVEDVIEISYDRTFGDFEENEDEEI